MVKNQDKEMIAVGKFGAPHGVRGHIKLLSYMDVAEDILLFSYLTDRAHQRSMNLTLHGKSKKQLVVSLEGCESREDAQKLCNTELYASRSELPTTTGDDSEFYIHELVGLKVLCVNSGESLGSVEAVHNFGAGDVLEILPHEGKSFMVMFDKQNVPNINLTERALYYSPPDIL